MSLDLYESVPNDNRYISERKRAIWELLPLSQCQQCGYVPKRVFFCDNFEIVI
jgi:hypothetical protein